MPSKPRSQPVLDRRSLPLMSLGGKLAKTDWEVNGTGLRRSLRSSRPCLLDRAVAGADPSLEHSGKDSSASCTPLTKSGIRLARADPTPGASGGQSVSLALDPTQTASSLTRTFPGWTC